MHCLHILGELLWLSSVPLLLLIIKKSTIKHFHPVSYFRLLFSKYSISFTPSMIIKHLIMMNREWTYFDNLLTGWNVHYTEFYILLENIVILPLLHFHRKQQINDLALTNNNPHQSRSYFNHRHYGSTHCKFLYIYRFYTSVSNTFMPFHSKSHNSDTVNTHSNKDKNSNIHFTSRASQNLIWYFS